MNGVAGYADFGEGLGAGEGEEGGEDLFGGVGAFEDARDDAVRGWAEKDVVGRLAGDEVAGLVLEL